MFVVHTKVVNSQEVTLLAQPFFSSFSMISLKDLSYLVKTKSSDQIKGNPHGQSRTSVLEANQKCLCVRFQTLGHVGSLCHFGKVEENPCN